MIGGVWKEPWTRLKHAPASMPLESDAPGKLEASDTLIGSPKVEVVLASFLKTELQPQRRRLPSGIGCDDMKPSFDCVRGQMRDESAKHSLVGELRLHLRSSTRYESIAAVITNLSEARGFALELGQKVAD